MTELYLLHAKTGLNSVPPTPSWALVDGIRRILALSGWELSNITPLHGEYEILLAKRGTIPLAFVLPIIARMLLVSIISYVLIRLSDNHTENQQVKADITETQKDTAIGILEDPTLTHDQKADLLAKLFNQNTGGGSNLKDYAILGIAALLAVAVVKK